MNTTPLNTDSNTYAESLDPVNRDVYNLFKSYRSTCYNFIETGCHYGNSLTHATIGGYKQLFSCDINKDRVEHCQARFKDAHILNVDSLQFLSTILPKVHLRSLFWLDAHSEGGGVPTIEELKLIKELSKYNDNTIVIDDIPIYFNSNLQELKKAILDINKDYNIRLMTIGHKTDYILVAEV